jgi:hypothetical protein
MKTAVKWLFRLACIGAVSLFACVLTAFVGGLWLFLHHVVIG